MESLESRPETIQDNMTTTQDVEKLAEMFRRVETGVNYVTTFVETVDTSVLNNVKHNLFSMVLTFETYITMTVNTSHQICEQVLLNEHLRHRYREMYNLNQSHFSKLVAITDKIMVFPDCLIAPCKDALTNVAFSRLAVFPEVVKEIKPRNTPDYLAKVDAYADPEVAYYAEHTTTGKQLRNRFIKIHK